MPARQWSSRERKVKRRGVELRVARGALQSIEARLKATFQGLAGGVDLLAHFLAGVSLHLAHAAEQSGELALLAEKLSARSTQRRLI